MSAEPLPLFRSSGQRGFSSLISADPRIPTNNREIVVPVGYNRAPFEI